MTRMAHLVINVVLRQSDIDRFLLSVTLDSAGGKIIQARSWRTLPVSVWYNARAAAWTRPSRVRILTACRVVV